MREFYQLCSNYIPVVIVMVLNLLPCKIYMVELMFDQIYHSDTVNSNTGRFTHNATTRSLIGILWYT